MRELRTGLGAGSRHERETRLGEPASSSCCGKWALEGQREISSSEAVGTAGNQDNPLRQLPQKY